MKKEFISPIFFRSKSNGTSRLILNLKTLNEFLEYNHFKTETVHTVHIAAIYIDDNIVIGDTYEECRKNLVATFTRNNLPRICFQFKGSVGYTYQLKKGKNS